jgi:hypothetical protein
MMVAAKTTDDYSYLIDTVAQTDFARFLGVKLKHVDFYDAYYSKLVEAIGTSKREIEIIKPDKWAPPVVDEEQFETHHYSSASEL